MAHCLDIPCFSSLSFPALIPTAKCSGEKKKNKFNKELQCDPSERKAASSLKKLRVLLRDAMTQKYHEGKSIHRRSA